MGGTFQLSATLGGAALTTGDNGTGVLGLTQVENLEAFCFEKRAIHVATRPMIDPTDAAAKFGIPSAILVKQETDQLTGVSFLVFLWQDTSGANPTLNVYATFVVQYGIKAGRGLATSVAAPDPTLQAALSGMDRCGVRVISA